MCEGRRQVEVAVCEHEHRPRARARPQGRGAPPVRKDKGLVRRRCKAPAERAPAREDAAARDGEKLAQPRVKAPCNELGRSASRRHYDGHHAEGREDAENSSSDAATVRLDGRIRQAWCRVASVGARHVEREEAVLEGREGEELVDDAPDAGSTAVLDTAAGHCFDKRSWNGRSKVERQVTVAPTRSVLDNEAHVQGRRQHKVHGSDVGDGVSYGINRYVERHAECAELCDAQQRRDDSAGDLVIDENLVETEADRRRKARRLRQS